MEMLESSTPLPHRLSYFLNECTVVRLKIDLSKKLKSPLLPIRIKNRARGNLKKLLPIKYRSIIPAHTITGHLSSSLIILN